ncbi:hypothetical protein TWF730_004377 [Orbilia blumenaviensis]|uniref:Uncharacterized protein n=1 Tax=Orbilia blumenaviensis TaxID=1796055 RepID=A0AAV9U226_9PEZI
MSAPIKRPCGTVRQERRPKQRLSQSTNPYTDAEVSRDRPPGMRYQSSPSLWGPGGVCGFPHRNSAVHFCRCQSGRKGLAYDSINSAQLDLSPRLVPCDITDESIHARFAPNCESLQEIVLGALENIAACKLRHDKSGNLISKGMLLRDPDGPERGHSTTENRRFIKSYRNG